MDNKKLATFSIAVFVVSVLVFATTLYLVFFRAPAPSDSSPKKIDTYKYDLGDFSTNIGSSGRYFKGKIVIETTNKKTPKLIEQNVEPIRDYILSVLISQDVKTMMSESGIENIKKDITKKVSEIIGTNDISNVYFTDYIIQ
ncbi:putative Flagellar basal body-associated protein FliL precursor [Acetoanaerobium sticklandii]|uniref:Flagellar protein FliL n=1 Tax=Acetoanaerobium sticklandii (strain ATCC 12662 / DSM 519 / JCM 1433 / CCUG 9281 / NCIMB 10654 / HF) TaxID=499177 RepID=E3PSJ4_ACESD|nr:flagellar basal body-associated FliL family protein [Acetoanaerobium sticklandii]CBH21848.1 putative Flagellar basal body-associated protein FliL precursor [Acetoanaerobium sticklandii]